MQPTLAAAEIRRNLTQYLSTTFALADEPVREALESFLNDPEQGIFRGPYLRLRTPFREADDTWRDSLEWHNIGFTPYRHQARAFERLSTLRGPAEPTLITTGTGSGKTESFLVPLLDHCRRERAQGNTGVKAVLLYPMNALATDQAQRIDAFLAQPELADVTAGLYIGDTPETGYPRVATRRDEIRRTRPDILLTNYKMLDLLLQREDDVALWEGSRIRYAVVDEFHTYDGAQGTDVAMLLRRLAAATGADEPGRPLGRICPVATSATLGGESRAARDEIRAVAETVFATPFPPESVVGEERVAPAEFIKGDIDYTLPLPNPMEVANAGDPHNDPTAMGRIMECFTGSADLTPDRLGKILSEHILTEAVLRILDGGVATVDELLELLPRHGAYSWGAAMRTSRAKTADALARYVALLSTARAPGTENEPLLRVETHMWVRSVSRLLRTVSQDRPRFSWHGEAATPPDGDSSTGGLDHGRLPAVHCRHCGRSGWAAISPERAPTELDTDPERIYRTAVADPKRVRPLIRASVAEAADRTAGQGVHVLEHSGSHARPVGADDVDTAKAGGLAGAFVLADLAHTKDAFRDAENERCPACGAEQGIRFLGSGPAALASVAITELFTGGRLAYDGEQPKTLLFNDSVQDAAHRSGFVANRSYIFSLRLLLASRLPADGSPVALNDLIADTVRGAGDPAFLPCVVPPDLHGRAEIDAVLSGESTGDRRTWELIGQRLAFAAVLEFGLRSRQGRTLELTRTAAAETRLEEPDRAAALARDLLRDSSYRLTDMPDLAAFRGYLRGLLERVRVRGGITHRWLDTWLTRAGTKRYGTIWGRRPDGMPAFPRGLPAPRFPVSPPKHRSEFDAIAGRGTWYQDWTARCLGLDHEAAARYVGRLLEALHEEGVLDRHTAEDGTTRVYALRPGHVQVRRLDADTAEDAGLACPVCHWRQTTHPDLLADWRGRPCPRYRCTGHLDTDPDPHAAEDYYRRLYLSADPFRVTTAEHTGQLTRAQRERVERRFADGGHHSDPNVLSCTPTLELGIDIGDLSAVLLGSLPPGPANYAQRAGRAGRRTGNAFLLTLVGRRARERYYLADPTEMIAGEVAPPGSYPSAVEILRRQYTAHLVDRTARGRLPGTPPLPRRASALFGDTGWLALFAEAAAAEGPRRVEEFLALFPGAQVSEEAARQVRDYATTGVKEAIAEAERQWERRRADLHARLATIEEAVAALPESDPQRYARKRQLRAEHHAVRRRISEIGMADAHGTLVELGLLPNYSLLDSSAALEATLTWEETTTGGDTAYHSEVREFRRPARQALTDFAPGNHYYARGYRHTVDGLDLGPEGNALERWRLCPECGYARTTAATVDTGPCPRCGDPRIGDRGSLHTVLRPTRAIARDRRDDALIRDDHDERRRRYYETVTTVDIPREEIAPGAWRLRGRTFGVEFTRGATVRHLNLGAVRMDRAPNATLAGERVRTNPFHVCEACGGATPDDPDEGSAGALTVSGRDNARTYHRPWCRQRRGDRVGHTELFLAHTLRTEALRVLLPAATVRVPERTTSFKAALMAGFTGVYGGALDHLTATTATMPDPEVAELRRRYLVVYDTLPGGSGYLNPRSGAEGIRELLTRALDVVEGCPCREDEGRAACHRCLLAHVDDGEFPYADRALAAEMLRELLDDWDTDTVSGTDEISLWDQVESELEARFLTALRRWADQPGTGRSLGVAERVNGRRTALLRLTGPDGELVKWQVVLQNTISGTRPDVVFHRLDAEPLRVAVYLDGYAYHAAPWCNRLADDAEKRARLRAHGCPVFQLTWDDIEQWESGNVPEQPVWRPYDPPAEKIAHRILREKLGGSGAELSDLVWTNPVGTLLGYLTDPDPERWRRRIAAAVAGLWKTPDARDTRGAPDTIGPRVLAALHGEPLPEKAEGALSLLRTTDRNGCPLTVLRDTRTFAFTALAVVDDREEAITADPDGHKRRWQAWLYWGNLLQFLSGGPTAGEGAQLAHSALGEFDPATLVLAGGGGLDESNARLSQDEFADMVGDSRLGQSRTPSAATEAATTVAHTRPAPDADATETLTPPDAQATEALPPDPGADPDPAWQRVLDLLDPDEPGLEELARSLARRGVPAPESGYEHGPGLWPAELAWPDRRVAVVLTEGIGEDERADQAKRDAAYAHDGWEVRGALGWNAAELAARLTEEKEE